MAHQTSACHNAFEEEKTNQYVWEAYEGALFTPQDSFKACLLVYNESNLLLKYNPHTDAKIYTNKSHVIVCLWFWSSFLPSFPLQRPARR